MSELNCTVCSGKGSILLKGFTTQDGTVYPAAEHVCHACRGSKVFPPLDIKEILSRVIAKQGKNKNKIRAAMVSPRRDEGVYQTRAYFVWRIARFHGGEDRTMPVVADMIICGDPCKKELEDIASQLAKIFFGTDMAAVLTWGKAFGLI